jgi:outer membrane protein TolC
LLIFSGCAAGMCIAFGHLIRIPNGDRMPALHRTLLHPLLPLHPICVFAACMLALPLAWSQPAPQPGLKAAIDAAWQRSPQARTLDARGDETLAASAAARTWIAGSPVAGLAQRNGTEQNDMRESEVSLSTPLWMPGQQSARQTLAQGTIDDLQAQLKAERLSIAGEVRERLWAVAAARAMLAEAGDHQHHLQAISDEVMQRVKAGDLARTDGMLAQQEVLAARGTVALAQRSAAEAWSRYHLLTGQSDIPELLPEPIAPAPQALPAQHPRMLAAQATRQRAQMALNLVNATRSEPPVVALSMRREHGGVAQAARNSVGLALHIAIGTSARNRPLETAALTRIATAMAQEAQTAAAIQADIELARQQLEVSQQALDAAQERTALTREHTRLIEQAFRLGERGLADLLRSTILSHDAQSAQHQEQVALGLAHARINQALGVTP